MLTTKKRVEIINDLGDIVVNRFVKENMTFKEAMNVLIVMTHMILVSLAGTVNLDKREVLDMFNEGMENMDNMGKGN